MLTPYTTNEEVRAVLGVTLEELSDDTLSLQIYEKGLVMELDAIGGDAGNDGALVTAFGVVKDIAESTRTRAQARLYDAVVLFSPFAAALQMESSAPIFTPKGITDGKAGITRYSDSPFKETFKAARDNYDRFRMNLSRAWAAYTSSSDKTTGIPALFAISSPGTDPVTG